MNNWYQVKVKYTKEMKDGTLKKVTEPYLISALNFSEAEVRIYDEVGEFVRGEFLVTDISRVDFSDIFDYNDADTWHELKIAYITEDGDSGKEKRVTNKFFVAAHDAEEAANRIKECLQDVMVDYSILQVKETSIQDVFPYEPESKKQDENETI